MKNLFKKTTVFLIATIMILLMCVPTFVVDAASAEGKYTMQVKVGDTISDTAAVSSGEEYTYIISFDVSTMPEGVSDYNSFNSRTMYNMFFVELFESGEWTGTLVDVDFEGAIGIPLFKAYTDKSWSDDEVSIPWVYYTTEKTVSNYPFDDSGNVLPIWKKWIEETPEDPSKVTGLFVDMRYTNKQLWNDPSAYNRGSMIFGPGTHFEIAITMKAPEFDESQIGSTITNEIWGSFWVANLPESPQLNKPSVTVTAKGSSGNYTQPLDTTNAYINLYKHLIMDEYATVPSTAFNFAITNGAATDDIKAGFDANKVVINNSSDVLFTKDATTKTDTTGAPEVAAKIEDEEKFASVGFTLDFSAIEFTEPGIYRYELNETNTGVDGVTYDTTTRYVDVYVENNATLDGLKVANVIMHTADGSGKNQGFVNKYDTYDLDLQKLLDGNYANMNEEFEFTIEIDTTDTIVADTSYTITTDSGVSVNNIVTNAGIGSTTIKLSHKDKVYLHALPYGTKVTITEESKNYDVSYTINGEDRVGNSLVEYVMTEDTSVVFTNTKTGIVPTGVFLSNGMMTLTIVGICCLASILYIKTRRKHSKDC